MRISTSVEIHCRPEVVFSWLDQPEKAKVWMKSVSKTEIISETPGRVGTTFKETVEETGEGLDMEGEITGYELNRSITFHLQSKIHSLDVTYLVEQQGEFVRLSIDSDIHWKFPVNIISLFMGIKMKAAILSQTSEELNALKELCEKGTPDEPAA
jgi:hypothetical protein